MASYDPVISIFTDFSRLSNKLSLALTPQCVLGLPPFSNEKAGHLFVGGLGDGSPPAGSRGRAPGGGSGAKPPKAERFLKRYSEILSVR